LFSTTTISLGIEMAKYGSAVRISPNDCWLVLALIRAPVPLTITSPRLLTLPSGVIAQRT
jgi:hypothetical protein